MTAFGQFIDKAAAEGFGGTLPVGENVATLLDTKYGKTQAGKQQIGLHWKLVTGESGWSNLNFTEDNGKALAIFFRQLAALGIDQAFLDSLPTTSLEPVAARMKQTAVGRWYKVRCKTWGTDNNQNEVSVLGDAEGSAAPAQAQPQYQPAPQQYQQPIPQQAPQQYAPGQSYQPAQYAPQNPVDPSTGYPARPGI